MTEPDNLALVLIGSLNDTDPWHLELWARDDANAKGSTARWYQAGVSDHSPDFRRVSWPWLEDHARELGFPLTHLGTGAL
jgi:hypothetical protein